MPVLPEVEIVRQSLDKKIKQKKVKKAVSYTHLTLPTTPYV